MPYAIRYRPYAALLAVVVWLGLGALSPSEGATRIAVLPFENVSGNVKSPTIIMPLIRSVLRQRGYEVVSPDSLEPFLFRQRIRATSKLNREHLVALGKEFDVSLALVGSIDLFADTPGNPQWGVSSRLLDTRSGMILWAGAAGFTGDDFTGFLGLGTVTSPDLLAARVVDALFRGLIRGDGGEATVKAVPSPRSRKAVRGVYRDPGLETEPPRRVAVLPFENGTERRGAALIVDDLWIVGLFWAGRFEVADAGVISEALQTLGLAPYGSIDLESLQRIGSRAGVDAVILGRVEDYNEGLRPGTSTSPSIALDARMLDTKTGKILWMGYHEAKGEESQIVLEFGKIKSMVPLAMRVTLELAETM